jgi:betaine-aldehyde dehydrogenase/5-carboxymethyl-2-hydroxymuconic-semialdehyde dehydrogenase
MQEIIIDQTRISSAHYIGGKRVSSERKFIDLSPIDSSVLGEISAAGPMEVDMAVKAAREAFPAWAALGPRGRLPYLEKLAHIIEERVPELALVETTDNGSLYEASLRRVMKRGGHNIHWFAEFAAEKLKGPEWDTVPRNVRNKVLYQPAGVAALITPWNAPFMLSTWKVGPALAAGNTVVLKPPEWAPLTCSLLADFAEEAGLPPGVLNVVQGIGEVAGDALVKHPGVNRISFTGSVATARIIGQNAAKNLTPVSFELGGKSPLVVFADADLELAVDNMIEQYDNAGQVCLSGTRLLVQSSVADELLERMKERAAKLIVGNPLEFETQVGPLIHPEHFAKVDGFVQRAIRDGATLVYGGKGHARRGLYYEPTLFTNVAEDSELFQQEVFGPVLIFDTFDSEAEAIRKANHTEFGLAAIIFTRDEERARRVSEAISAGLVWVNCFYVRDLAQPFGGAKKSGIGREGGIWSFDFFCDIKNVTHRHGTLSLVEQKQ